MKYAHQVTFGDTWKRSMGEIQIIPLLGPYDFSQPKLEMKGFG